MVFFTDSSFACLVNLHNFCREQNNQLKSMVTTLQQELDGIQHHVKPAHVAPVPQEEVTDDNASSGSFDKDEEQATVSISLSSSSK